MTIGIYKLTFKDTDKVYIGQSVNIEKRFIEHISRANTGTASKKLQDAFQVFGVPTLNIIEECTEDILDELEDINIQIYNSVDGGFNTCYTSLNKPDNTCENNGMSTYSKEQILEVFNILVEQPGVSFIKISGITKVASGTVAQIACGGRHQWLSKEYPEKYAQLISTKHKRKSVSSSAKYRGILYPPIISPLDVVYQVDHLNNFAKEHLLDSGNLSKLLNGKAKSHKGWRVHTENIP